MDKLNVTIKDSKSKDGHAYIGVINLPNTVSTKLAKKDGTYRFDTVSSLKTVARSLAKKLDAEVVYEETQKAAKTKKCCGTCKTKK